MVVAVGGVRVVEMPVNNEVEVVTMGNEGVTAVGAMSMTSLVALAGVGRGTGSRIHLRVGQGVLFVGALRGRGGGGVVQVPVMEEVHMPVMRDLEVTAPSAVEVVVATMNWKHHLDGAMRVAVVSVEVVQNTVGDVIEVVAVRDARVPTVGAMLVTGGGDLSNATSWVRGRDGDGVLVNVKLVGAVEMTVVEVTFVAVMKHLNVTAAWLVNMRAVVVMLGTDLVNLSVMVAVARVGVMKVPANEVINMVGMGNLRMAARVAMDMIILVTLAGVASSASGILVTQDVLIKVISVRAVEAARVEKPDVVVMLDALVTAAITVGVVVVIVRGDAGALGGHSHSEE